ncbi:hypothetical protein [Telluribacter humicola]|uniref:hypothetical protein n=1 Tax=Telluribacter humicola TaxID=1720261 RepID=UPI001A95E859|nr:hypothetical protein [Telluribacter humicola]
MKKQIWAVGLVCVMGIAAPFVSEAQTNTNKPRQNTNQPRTNQQTGGQQTGGQQTGGQQTGQQAGQQTNDPVGQMIQGLTQVDMTTMNYDNMGEQNFVDVSEVLQEDQMRGLDTQMRGNQNATDIQNQLNTRFRERNLIRANQEVVGVHSDGRYIIRNRQE